LSQFGRGPGVWWCPLRRHPEALAAIVNNPAGALDSRLILALKALR
jgi:hypothetical protein